MQATVEKTSDIGRKLNVTVPADRVESAVQARLKQISRTVKMQGFRKGKVPLKIVEQQYRGTALSEVLGDIINETMQEALASEELVPAVQPDVEPKSIEKGEDFTYVATFDVMPEFENLDLEGIEIKRPESDVEDADIDRVIDNMRKQKLSWKEVKRKAKKGDRVICDFDGSVDGEPFDGGKGDDYPVVIGEGQMLADFEKGLIGMKAGETQDVDVEFPEDYAEQLAGKKATFKITANTVSAPDLPEIDEEFIKSFGIESGKEDDLRAEVSQNLNSNLEGQLSSMIRQRTFDALVERNEIDLPEKMVKEEAQRMVQEQKNQLIGQGLDPKLLEGLPEPEFDTLKPQAEKRVALGLLMMEIVRKEGLSPDAEKVKERIEKMAAAYQDPQEFIDYYNTDQQALAQVQSLVLEEQVVDHLLEKAKVSVEKVKASDVLNMQ